MTSWFKRQIDRPYFIQVAFLTQVVLTTVFLVFMIYANAQRISSDVELNAALIREAGRTSAENQEILNELAVSQATFLCIVVLPPESRTPETVLACEQQAREGGS